MKFIPYAKQSIDESDLQAVQKALRQNIITRGELVEEFESSLATYCNAKYAVAFNSASTALFATAFAANVSPYDHFITSPNTFIATATAGFYRKAKLHLIDIESDSGNIDLKKVELFIKKHHSSRGNLHLYPVHFSGLTVDMKALNRIINDKTIIVEDAAHALGSTYVSGEKVGSCAYSDMTVFSFHPAKTITTGEGGAVTTNNEELYKSLKLYRNNGIERDELQNANGYPGYYEVVSEGGNFNFTEFQAALGLSQLKRIDQFIEKRRKLVKHYRSLLKNIPHLSFLTDHLDDITAFHLFVVKIDYKALNTTRTKVMEFLKSKGIGTQVHYIPLYQHPFFKELHFDTEDFPVMDNYFSEALSLPLYYDLSESDVEYVVSHLKKALGVS